MTRELLETVGLIVCFSLMINPIVDSWCETRADRQAKKEERTAIQKKVAADTCKPEADPQTLDGIEKHL